MKATKKQIKAANESLKRLNLGLENIGGKNKIILHCFCDSLTPTDIERENMNQIRIEILKATSIEDILWLSQFKQYSSIYYGN